MISVSSNYKTNATKPVRNINAKISIGAVDFGIDDIVSFELSRSPSDGGLSIGGTAAARLTATIRATMLPTMDAYKITASIGFIALTQIGTFYITDLTQEKGYVSIEAYDRFYYLDKPCSFNGSADGKVESLSFPATHQEMLEYISKINGFSLSVTCEAFAKVKTKPIYNSEATNPTNKYYTYREIIGFIAACNGCNAQFDANDKLIFTRPSNSVETIEEGACESLSVAQDSGFTVKGIRFTIGTDTAFYIDANGTAYDETLPGVLEAVNPLATVEIMEYVWNQLGGFHYYAADISRRGRGWLMPDDLISVTTGDKTYNALVTTISYSLSKDGGFEERITSEAESTEQSANRYSPAADHTTNVGAGKYNSTTIVNDPVIIAKNTAEYLQYEYSIVGYNASDDLITYAQDGRSGIIVQGYSAYPYISNDDLGAEHGNLYFVNGIYGSTKKYATAFDSLKFSVIFSKVTTSQRYSLYMLTEYTKDGETTKKYENTSAYVSLYGDFSVAIKWTDIYSPTTNFPNGRARLYLGMNYTSRNSMSGVEERIFVVGNTIDVAFSSIDEYNSAVKLTRAPIEKKDVTQTISKIVEAGGTSDFPELGEIDVLYIDSSDNSAYKWSSKINAYYCVGRDYYAVRKIQSSADPETSQSDTIEAQIMQDMRSAADWTLSSSFVPPKGYICISDFGDGNYPGIKIGNGNSPWSDLIYCNIYNIPVATDTEIGGVKIGDNISVSDDGTISVDLSSYLKSDDIADWAKSATKPEYTASEVGAATVDDIKAAVDDIEIGGSNLLLNTKSFSNATSTSLSGALLSGSASLTDEKYRGLSVRGGAVAESQSVVCRYGFKDFDLGETFTFSFFARGNVPELRVYFYGETGYVQVAKCTNSQGEANTNADGRCSFSVSDSWKKYRVTWTLKSTGDTSIAKWILIRTFNSTIGQEIYVCGCKLEKGNKATDWSPAADDVLSLEERVSALEAAILSGGEG